MMPMTTWKQPRIEKKTDGRNINTEKIRPMEYEKKRWAANTSPHGQARGGEKRRQIDYIIINATNKNTATTAQRNPHWRENMNQNQQHRVRKMKLYYNAAKKYKTPPHRAQGGIQI